MNFDLKRIAFADLSGWESDQVQHAVAPFLACHRHSRSKPYRRGTIGLESRDFAAAAAAMGNGVHSACDARALFERHFLPYRVVAKPELSGFVTGYYEPEVAVSGSPDATYRYPFFSPPPDLIRTDRSAELPAELEGFAYARRLPDGSLVEHPDRQDIECGALDGRDLEIAWAKSRVDVFFAHVQGAARLVYSDGSVKRITYAAKSGHAFTAIGRILVERGEIARDAVTMSTIRAWLAENAERQDELLWRNRSCIFFREVSGPDAGAEGPVAAAKVPLTAGRSLAVDRLIHTFATPVFVEAPELTCLDDGLPFSRLMIAQDTGSAIVGPARGDIFVGSGHDAGVKAGSVKHKADFTILVPRVAAERFS